jgi:hypothetical protein
MIDCSFFHMNWNHVRTKEYAALRGTNLSICRLQFQKKVYLQIQYSTQPRKSVTFGTIVVILLESPCIRDPLDCVCIGLLGLTWGEAQPPDYIIVILVLESIEQPFSPFQHK